MAFLMTYSTVCAQLNELILKDSTVLHPGNLVLKNPVFKKQYLLADDQQYEISQVRSYKNIDGYYRISYLSSKTPQIFRREVDGPKIDLFSNWSTISTGPSYSGGMYMPGGSYPIKNWYFTKNNDELQTMKPRMLAPAVQDNLMAFKKVKAAKTWQTVGTVSAIGAIGFFIAGAVVSLNKVGNNPPPPPGQSNGISGLSPLLLGTVFLAPLPWIARPVSKNKMKEAVKIYNE